MDADDLWRPNKIKYQLNFMKRENYLISHTSYKIINENGNIIGFRKARDFNNLNQLLKSCDIGLSSVLLKKEILNKNCLFPDIKTKEDFVLWLKILRRNIKIGSVDKYLM